ncbi:dihydrouridine synthase, partial [Nannochloropsis gaditana]
MVAFRARSKWRRGWRRLQSDAGSADGLSSSEAFQVYRDLIITRLCSPEWPLPSPPRRFSFLREGFDETQPVFVLAPMVLQSERAFRLLVQRYGVTLTFSPMLLARNVLLKRNEDQMDPYVLELLRPCADDTPVIAQLAGSDPLEMLAAAQRLWDGGQIAGVDINLGCPQQCAKAGNYGAYLAEREPETAAIMVRLISQELGVPVSCKLRNMYDVDTTTRLARRLAGAGASMLTVHGRSPRERDHQSLSDLDVIRAVREAVPVPVVANGNCRTREDAERAMEYTGCDGFMSAIGLLRNPRLFGASGAARPAASPAADATAPAVPGHESALSASGTLVDPEEAFSCAWEYLRLAEAHPPPEVRCVRDHLQALLQGLLQQERVALWNLLGSSQMVLLRQFSEFLRLSAVECGVALPEGERLVPVLSLGEIKSLHRREINGQEDEEDDSWGMLFLEGNEME